MVRVLSWNVNGLRAALKRLGLTISQFLDSLHADIICLQETKLRRQDLDSDLACVEGWDAFFCCDQTHATGYSGCATYVRTAVALPFGAQEGFTGCVPGANGGVAVPHPALQEHFSVEELAELDREGRVTVTDHGAFVLFNIYGPAITSADAEAAEERHALKVRFFKALEMRWRDLLQQGRAVVAVGDFNICPAPIDHRDPGPAAAFYGAHAPNRRWLHRLLHGVGPDVATETAAAAAAAAAAGGGPAAGGAVAAPGGAVWSQGAAYRLANGTGSSGGGGGDSTAGKFTDAFRAYHPTRACAFTCWSTATNARVNNFGSRIDLVLTAGLSVGRPPSTAAAAAAGVAAAAGYGNGPGYGSGSNGSGSGGRSDSGAQVWVAAADIWPEQQGSDHCPVWADFEAAPSSGGFPCSATAPPCAMRFAFAGKQLKLLSFLQRGGGGSNGAAAASAATQEASDSQGSPNAAAAASQQQQQQAQAQGASLPSSQASQVAASSAGFVCPKGRGGGGGGAAAGSQRGKAAAAATAAAGGRKQATLKSFLQPPPLQAQQQPEEQPEEQPTPGACALPQQEQQGMLPPPPPQQEQEQQQQPGAFFAAELAAAEASRQVSQAEAKQAWQRIQQQHQQVPRCKHGQPAEQKRVNKSGANQGRYFWRCRFPAGQTGGKVVPGVDCGYFKWVEARPGDPAHLTLAGSSKGSGGSGYGGGSYGGSGYGGQAGSSSKRQKL